MFNNTIAERCYDYIELGKYDKLYSLIRKKDLTGISLVSVVDLLLTRYEYTIEQLKAQGAIVDVAQLIEATKTCLQDIQTNLSFKPQLKSIKRGLDQLLKLWRQGKSLNEMATEELNQRAIEKIIQASSASSVNDVNNLLILRIQEHLTKIYQNWLKDTMDDQPTGLSEQIDNAVKEYFFNSWQQGLLNTFGNEAVKTNLESIIYEILFNHYQEGTLDSDMTENIIKKTADEIVTLVFNKILKQYPKLAELFSNKVTREVGDSHPISMLSYYENVARQIVVECKESVHTKEISHVVNRFVVDVIKRDIIKTVVLFPENNSKQFNFGNYAIEKFLAEFKQNHEQASEKLNQLIAEKVLAYLQKLRLVDREMGKAIESDVIKVFLVEWKNGEIPEFSKSIELIVMEDATALFQQIDNCISSAALANKVIALEQAINILMATLSKHGITIQTNQNDNVSMANSTKYTNSWYSTAMVGSSNPTMFGNNAPQDEKQEEQTPTASHVVTNSK